MSNPFQPTKFEWEKRPVIYLSKRAKKLAKTKKPVYISGSRGTGKTTILKSLSTKQICQDNLLRSQYGASRFTWFGQYIQFNNSFQPKTERIVDAVAPILGTDDIEYRVFCAYFELTVLKQFLNDIVFFQDIDFLHFKAKTEKIACQELQSYFAQLDIAKDVVVCDFVDARRLVRTLQTEFLKSGANFNAQLVSDIISLFSPGEIIRFIKEFALEAVQSRYFRRNAEIDFFMLVDDCEMLSDKQQVALNTYIRNTEGVAKWVISYLSGRYNTTQTYLRNTTLTKDDRGLLPLNDMSEKDFKEFCEHVTNLRLNKFLEKLSGPNSAPRNAEPFSFERKFGAFSYNFLIGEVIRASQNRKLLNFKSHVMSTKGDLAANIKVKWHSRFSCTKDKVPYIEHIVMEALGINLRDYPDGEHQETLAKTIDGKQAAAYIAFCAKFNLRPIYAGENYFLALSDCCIRDYLDAMARLFDVLSGLEGRDEANLGDLRSAAVKFFKDVLISHRIQDRVIRNVSWQKYESLEKTREEEPYITRIVLALAHLQKNIEHDVDDWTSVKRSVRGKFLVSVPKTTGASANRYGVADLHDILKRLEFDRYIKIADAKKRDAMTEYVITVHRRLRPYFRCGHSGPYDPPIILSPHSILEALNGGVGFEPENWARRQYDAVKEKPDRNQQELGFDG